MSKLTEYDSIPAIRWSTLAKARKSPKHFRYAETHPTPDTDALRIGRAVHCAVFEPERFAERFVTYGASKTTGEGARKAWAAFQGQARANGQTIVDAAELEQIQAMAAEVRACPTVAQHLMGGQAEVTEVWIDPETGLACKARLDYRSRSGIIIYLKTAINADVRAFGAAAWRYGYFHQLEHYAKGNEATPVLLVVVEKDAPHDVAVFEPTQETREAAREEWRALLNTIAECRRTGRYPGRYPEPTYVAAPAYVLGSEDDEWEVTTEARR